jgi:hypothetical protein
MLVLSRPHSGCNGCTRKNDQSGKGALTRHEATRADSLTYPPILSKSDALVREVGLFDSFIIRHYTM